jgi:uncharacterized protein (DUF2384 family)
MHCAERAEKVFGTKGAIEWLITPAHGLGGKIPVVVASTKEGATKIIKLLGRIDRGTAL